MMMMVMMTMFGLLLFFIPTEENGENGFYEVVKKYAIGWLAVLYLLVLEIPLSTHIN